ncbi:hypothetical protein [Polaromonas sp.]|uniref:hypothetical protein n=1 Tax=Polaromonas sp. TaxID=1869339 RepID=UPI003265B7AF
MVSLNFLLKLVVIGGFVSSVALHASEKTMQACIRSSAGSDLWKCLDRENGVLKKEQRRLLSTLNTELTACRINWVGYHPERALVELKLAQKNWDAFAIHDCSYGTETFGQGSAAGSSALQCHMAHLRTRNARLSQILQEVLSTRQMLIDWDREQQYLNQQNHQKFVECPGK